MSAFDDFIAEWTKLTLAAHARNVRYIYVDDEDIVDDVGAWLVTAYEDDQCILTDDDELVLLERMVAEEQQEDYGVWLSHSNFEDNQ
jgi:hypothetical protein